MFRPVGETAAGESENSPRIGVLALQGDVEEHAASLSAAGAVPREVKLPEDLLDLDGLIIPGGESTTIGKLLNTFGFMRPLRELAREGFPLYGTCAGMILLADGVAGAGVEQPTIGGMDVRVERNAFGRQAESFEQDLDIDALGEDPFHAVFIRAPIIREVGSRVQVLARLPDGTPVAARQGNLLVSSFHPELTGDPRFHRYFVQIVDSGVSKERLQACGA